MIPYYIPTTEEQERIRAGERETVNAFFMKNVDFIAATARGWLLRKVGRFTRSDVDELVNEAYLYLPHCDTGERGHFVTSLRDCFVYFYYGGRQYYHRNYGYFPDVVSLDKPLRVYVRSGDDEDGDTLGERLPAPIVDEEDDGEGLQAVLTIAEELLTPKVYEVFRYRVLTGFSAAEIAEELGKSKGAILSQMSEMSKVFVLNYRRILALLARTGCDVRYYVEKNITPPTYEDALAALERRRERSRQRFAAIVATDEGRAARNAYQRARRAQVRQERHKAD